LPGWFGSAKKNPGCIFALYMHDRPRRDMLKLAMQIGGYILGKFWGKINGAINGALHGCVYVMNKLNRGCRVSFQRVWGGG